MQEKNWRMNEAAEPTDAIKNGCKALAAYSIEPPRMTLCNVARLNILAG